MFASVLWGPGPKKHFQLGVPKMYPKPIVDEQIKVAPSKREMKVLTPIN
jgi:hypothetical protein